MSKTMEQAQAVADAANVMLEAVLAFSEDENEAARLVTDISFQVLVGIGKA